MLMNPRIRATGWQCAKDTTDEDDEKVGETTKTLTEYGSGSETSDEALDDDSVKKNQAQDLQNDDTSTCGSEGEQDAMGQDGANIATEEEDPEEYDDCVAWRFLHRADQALKFLMSPGTYPRPTCGAKRSGARTYSKDGIMSCGKHN